MKASPVEFRLRSVIVLAILLLGFYAPWIDLWGIGRRMPLLEWLPLQLSHLEVGSFAVNTSIVLVAGALLAAIGAALRIGGAAWLGPATLLHGQMLGDAMVADGPYRYVRNPLYLGLMCSVAALALLMPPTGALFVLFAVSFFLLRLVFAEEAFLDSQIGESYGDYLRATPRLFPRFHASLLPSGRKPQWLRGVLSEIAPLGIFLALAFESWSFDLARMTRTIVVFYGIGLVARAAVMGERRQPGLPE